MMTTRYFSRPEGQLAYDDTGAGPLVMCVPSMGDLRGEYRFLAPRLAEAGYRVISLDVRGHGETSATGWGDYSVGAIGSDITALVGSLKAGPAVIVGCSMAAGAAVWAAAEAPELIAGLALIGPFVRGGGDGLGKLLFGTLFSRPWGPALWRTYYNSLYPSRKPADFAAYTAALRANLAEPGRQEALLRMLAASKSAAEARLPRVKAPALVLMGSRDPDFKDPEAEARWVAGQLKTRYQMIAGAGHYPQAEMPEVTAGLLIDFLKNLSPAGEILHAA